MDVSALVNAVRNLTSLELLNRLGHVNRNRTGLRRRHHTARTEDTGHLTNHRHHVGSSNDGVKIQPAFLNLLNQVSTTRVVCASVLCNFKVVVLAENENADRTTGTMRKHDSATNHLVGMFWVHTEIEVDFDRLVELHLGLFEYFDCRLQIVSLVTIKSFSNLFVFFSSEHEIFLSDT